MNPNFLSDLARVVGPGGLLQNPADLLTYESDALVHLRATPAAVVLPQNAAEVQAVVRLCRVQGVPFVARGHGSGLSGGALPVAGGVLIALSRMNRILEVDIPNLRAVVEPGVTNLAITKHVAPFGCYYAPDPSSQIVCSIGGNIAENSGGAHCLKYGFTVHHVLGVEAVLPDGELVHLGGAVLDTPGLDLLGVLVGSEGTLAIVTKATVRLLRRPEEVMTLLAGFASIDAAGEAVSAIIARRHRARRRRDDGPPHDRSRGSVRPSQLSENRRRAHRRARRPAIRSGRALRDRRIAVRRSAAP